MNEKVLAEVSTAYTEETRNLHFRASEAVDPLTAQLIMQECCPGYNNFRAEFLGLFPDDCKIVLAREGSVCIYVTPGLKPLPTANKIKADEYNEMGRDTFGLKYHENHGGYKGEIRIWWD